MKALKSLLLALLTTLSLVAQASTFRLIEQIKDSKFNEYCPNELEAELIPNRENPLFRLSYPLFSSWSLLVDAYEFRFESYSNDFIYYYFDGAAYSKITDESILNEGESGFTYTRHLSSDDHCQDCSGDRTLFALSMSDDNLELGTNCSLHSHLEIHAGQLKEKCSLAYPSSLYCKYQRN